MTWAVEVETLEQRCKKHHHDQRSTTIAVATKITIDSARALTGFRPRFNRGWCRSSKGSPRTTRSLKRWSHSQTRESTRACRNTSPPTGPTIRLLPPPNLVLPLLPMLVLGPLPPLLPRRRRRHPTVRQHQQQRLQHQRQRSVLTASR